MEETKKFPLHFLTSRHIDEIVLMTKSRPVLVRSANPEIKGVLLYQGDERRGYEFLMFGDRAVYEELAEIIEEAHTLPPTLIELREDSTITLQTNYYLDDIENERYLISTDKARKVLQVEYLQDSNIFDIEYDM